MDQSLSIDSPNDTGVELKRCGAIPGEDQAQKNEQSHVLNGTDPQEPELRLREDDGANHSLSQEEVSNSPKEPSDRDSHSRELSPPIVDNQTVLSKKSFQSFLSNVRMRQPQGSGERKPRRSASPSRGHQRRNSQPALHETIRRPRPRIQVSWIQDKQKQIRNTWNSRGDSVNDISLETPKSPRSPRSPTLKTPPEQTMDIVLSLPKRYQNRRKTKTFLYSLNSSNSSNSSNSCEANSQQCGRDSYSEDGNCNSVSPLVDMQGVVPPPSESETPPSTSRPSLIQLCQPLPHTSNTCVLSVSNDVGREDMLRPDDRVMHIRLPRRRDRRQGSVLRNLVESRLVAVFRESGYSESNENGQRMAVGGSKPAIPESGEIQDVNIPEKIEEIQQNEDSEPIEDRKEESRTVEDLIHMVDDGSPIESHSIVAFDDIDFSQSSTPMQEVEDDDEDWMSLFNELMREECPAPIDGEEMERGTGEEERLIWDENEEKREEEETKGKGEEKEEEEIEEVKEKVENDVEKEDEGEKVEEEKQREEAEQEVEQDEMVDEPETVILEEQKPDDNQQSTETEPNPQQTPTEPCVTDMPIETMLQTMGYELSSLTQLENLQEPVEATVEEVQEEPLAESIEETEMKEWEPTEEQKERVRKWEVEFQLRMEEKEREEMERREQIRHEARVQLEKVNEEFSQLCEFHRHERCDFTSATPQWREIEFRNVLGECGPLLLPLIRIMDLLLGAVIQPIDDLRHAREAVLSGLRYEVCEDSLIMRSIRWKYPEGTPELWLNELRRIVMTSRYLETLFSSFSYYVECCLGYTAERVTSYYGRLWNDY